MSEVFLNGVLAVNDKDLSCHFREFEISGDTDMHDATTFCNEGSRSFKPGLTERGITASGFWDAGLDVDGVMTAALSATANNLVTFAHGRTVGAKADLLNTKLASYGVGETVGDLIAVSADFRATQDGSIQWGKQQYGTLLLFAQGVDDTMNGASFDAGAEPFDDPPAGWNHLGYIIHVHVDGDLDFATTEWEVKVQHSSNDSDWTDLETISGTGSDAQQVVDSEYDTSMEQYRRAIISTFDGDGEATFVVGFARGATTNLAEDVGD